MENVNVDREGARQPRWWNKEHESTWERIKAALRADWEQTKSDFSKKHGKDLDQDVGDTVKQMAGKEQPPTTTTTTSTATPGRGDWDEAETAVRYGYGSSQYYRDDDSDWNDRLESKLREEWTDLKTGRTWDEIKGHVRRGWEFGRRKIS